MENLLRKITPKDYISFHIICLKLMGLYPPKNRVFNIIYQFVAVPHFCLIFATVILELTDIIISDEKYERKILSIGMMMMHVEATVRYIAWFIMRDGIEEVMSIIQRSSFNFKIFGDTHTHDQSFVDKRKQTRISVPEYQECVTYKTSLFCSVWYISYMLYVVFNISSSYTINFFQDTHEEFNPWLNKTSTFKEFVYPMWLPFDVSVSDGYYLVAFFYQPYAFWFLMGGYLTLDCLYLNIITQLRSQVIIISYALSHVDGGRLRLPDSDNDWRKEEIRLVKCIQELQIIFRAAQKLEDMFNIIYLIHSGLGLFILCCLSYTAMKAESFDLPHLMMMTSVVLLEVFTSCWFCNSFTLEFSNTLRAMYELDWLRYSPKLRRMVIFTMMRLQKPPIFTMGKWANVDMPFFISLLKMVYSFYMLISKGTK